MALKMDFPAENAEVQKRIEEQLQFSMFAATALNLFPIKYTSDTAQFLVAGQPKSASTFVYQTLLKILELHPIQMGEHLDLHIVAQEMGMAVSDKISGTAVTHDIWKPILMTVLNQGLGFVSHHHTMANAATIAHLNAFPQIKVIVTVRNIPDSLVSFRDHILRDWEQHSDEFFWSYGYPNHVLPFSSRQMFEQFIEFDADGRFEFLIDLFGPWYFAFLESWHRLAAAQPERVKIVNYDKIATNPLPAFTEMLEILGAAVDAGKIEQSVGAAKSDKDGSNINVGRSGRGREELSDRHMEHLRRLGGYWNDPALIDQFLA